MPADGGRSNNVDDVVIIEVRRVIEATLQLETSKLVVGFEDITDLLF